VPLPEGRIERTLAEPSPIKAGDGTRTRDIQLGKLTLYQLSYTRVGSEYTAAERREKPFGRFQRRGSVVRPAHGFVRL
jgi:hypothetical protein